jgi:large subunit ribosomal protein L7/L12
MISSCILLRQRLPGSLCSSSAIRRSCNRTFQASAWCGSEASAAPAIEKEATAPALPPPIIWTTDRLSADQIAKVDSIFHKMLWLDMFETSMLTGLINERLGLVLTPKQRTALNRQMANRAGGGTSKSAAAVAPVEEGPKLVDLKLTGFDAKSKIKVIKEVRSIAGLGLKEAKEMVEGFPKVIMKGMKEEQALELKVKLEAIGAIIELA